MWIFDLKPLRRIGESHNDYEVRVGYWRARENLRTDTIIDYTLMSLCILLLLCLTAWWVLSNYWLPILIMVPVTIAYAPIWFLWAWLVIKIYEKTGLKDKFSNYIGAYIIVVPAFTGYIMFAMYILETFG